ncbi:MAG TPA: signal peptidase II [Devosia sp.]|jgi:signal peptidase II|nr:signal peptidase II [Devosia sp.]
MSRRGLWLSLALGFAAFALDRLHKYVQVDLMHWPEQHFVPVLPFLDLGLVYNPGVSYGLLGALPVWAVAIVVGVALAALVVWWARSPSALVRAGLAICIGGALSNAADRLIYGAVADFFWLHIAGFSFFVFNLADAAITVGVCLLLLDLLGFGGRRAANAA